MHAPLLSSKYRVPAPRPDAVARRRLDERRQAMLGTALTVVSAPAGFGKTSLLADWLSAASDGGASVAWLSLDPTDDQPVQFWTYVVTAVHSAVDGVGTSSLQLLRSSPPSVDAALAALLNELDGLGADLVLVLDDVHLVGSPAIHDQVRFLLEHQPPRLHLVLATRADPPLPLAQLRARGRLVEVRAEDLRFTTDETATYLNDAKKLGLSDDQLATLDGRTEGWIAALQLAALSLQGRENVAAFLAGFAGDHRYIVDYLVEEVLARQPADIRSFLLQTTILERLTGPLCDAVTERDGGVATLVALERANLFLVPLDDRRQWYRYHHLFADVLRAHLRDERPDDVAALHRRASEWFERHDDIAQAVSHAQAGGDLHHAAGLMESAMPQIRRERREADVARWMRDLPDDVLRTRPVLDVAFVGALAQAARFDTIGERLDRVETLLRLPDGSWPQQPPPHVTVTDHANYQAIAAHIAMYRAALALVHGDVPATIDHAHTALAIAPPDDGLAQAAAGALAGIACWTTGDLAGAFAAYTESVAGLARIGFAADVLGCTITLGDLCRTQGRLTDALRVYRDALDHAEPEPGSEYLRGTADMHVGIAGVLLERDDSAGAREHLATAQSLGEHNGLPQNPYRSRVVLARLAAAERRLDDALTLLDEAQRFYVGDYAPDVQPVPAVRARLQLRRGELAPVEQWAADRELGVDDGLCYLREYEHLTFARLLIARRDERSYGLLDRLRAAAEDGGRGASVIEVLMLQALARADRDLPAALTALHRAVTLAAPEGFVRLFTDEGTPMAKLFTALRKRPDAPPHVRRLLAATTTGAPVRQALPDPLSARELEVVRLLGGDLDGPDLARELSVSLNTLRSHTKSIYAKLGVTSRRAAVRRARELELIPGAVPRH